MFEFPRWLTTVLEFEAMVLTFLLALAIPFAITALALDAWERHNNKRNRQ
jgi:hypothetical protein